MENKQCKQYDNLLWKIDTSIFYKVKKYNPIYVYEGKKLIAFGK